MLLNIVGVFLAQHSFCFQKIFVIFWILLPFFFLIKEIIGAKKDINFWVFCLLVEKGYKILSKKKKKEDSLFQYNCSSTIEEKNSFLPFFLLSSHHRSCRCHIFRLSPSLITVRLKKKKSCLQNNGHDESRTEGWEKGFFYGRYLTGFQPFYFLCCCCW